MLRIAGVVAVLALTGCGGDDRKEALKAAETWLKAVGERDIDGACALMSDSAVAAVRNRSGLNPRANCAGVVRVYSGAFEEGDIDRLLEIGLETEGAVKEGEIGVFPVSGPRETQVILMRRQGDEWKVASTSLGPTRPPG